MTGVIYHYCNPATFLSIISNKKLWLTSLQQSNDFAEGNWCLERWLHRFGGRDHSKRILRNGARLAVTTRMREVLALGTCFSEKEDLLSQWRGYATDGKGFSIGFSREVLEETVSSCSDIELEIVKIKYGLGTTCAGSTVFSAMTDAFEEEISAYSESNGTGSMQIDNSPEKRAERDSAIKGLFRYKNPAFEEEREWRILAVASPGDIKGVEFRETRNAISPFYRLAFPAEAIVSVTLGPANPTSSKIVEMALEENDMQVDVGKSSASYVSR